MASPAVIDQARKVAVLVRVQGSDPKGVKMRKHAFHHYHSGRTTLSASGMILPHTLYDSEVSEGLYSLNGSSSTLIVTTASIFEPFLTLQHRETIPQGKPDLIPGVQIDCMVESEWLQQDCKYLDKEASQWLPTQLLALERFDNTYSWRTIGTYKVNIDWGGIVGVVDSWVVTAGDLIWRERQAKTWYVETEEKTSREK